MKIREARVKEMKDRDLNIVMKDPNRINSKEGLKVKAPEKKEWSKGLKKKEKLKKNNNLKVKKIKNKWEDHQDSTKADNLEANGPNNKRKNMRREEKW